MERIRQLTSHLTSPPSGKAALLANHPDDVVITLAVRSPLGKSKKGVFKDTPRDELLLAFLQSTVAKSGIEPSQVEDIVMGNVLDVSAPYVLRAAMLTAGFPDSTTVQTVNRFCSSGLMAVSTIANRIRCGEIDVGLAIGFEAMSVCPDEGAPKLEAETLSNPVAKDAMMPMGWTSENVAKDFSVTREEMDKFAYLSQTRASNAQKSGLFETEIVPVEINKKDPKTGSVEKIVVKEDDVIRHGTELSTLLKIRSAFPQWSPSQTTGGNASQNSDGAAAVLLMRRSKAEALGLKDRIIAKHVATSTVGVSPRVMGIGPRYAIPAVLKAAGIDINDVDLFEINEAFASMYVYCVQALGLDIAKVNVNGGAIALGHPLGATGARQIATGLAELQRRNGKILVTSMCMGTGMGAAAVFVRS